MRRAVPLHALVGALILAACATHPAPQPVALSACPPLPVYSPARQKALSDALKALDPSNPLNGMVVDYERMRDADRACLGAKPGP